MDRRCFPAPFLRRIVLLPPGGVGLLRPRSHLGPGVQGQHEEKGKDCGEGTGHGKIPWPPERERQRENGMEERSGPPSQEAQGNSAGPGT